MKLIRHIIYIFCIACGLFGCRAGNDTALPDLRETYKYRDTKPFGGYIAYHLLQNSYPRSIVQVQKKPFADTYAWTNDTASIFVNISRSFYTDKEEADQLIDFVYRGNTVFIAAAEIDTVFLRKLFIRQDSLKNFTDLISPYSDTKVQLVPAVVEGADSIKKYYYRPFSNYFSELNDRYCRIVGYNDYHRPNFITFFWGKGRFYLHCDPRAFSNYFLLQKDNYRYLQQVLQTMPEKPEHIYWNEYYANVNSPRQKNDDKESGSFWGAIFRNPPLKAAFWLILGLLLLYILFSGKRRQRIIPIIKPVQNSSVAFAEAIGGLYLKEKNNKTIAEKIISFFNESVRSRYFLNTSVVNKDFLMALSKKAAVPLNTTESLYRTIQQVGNMETTSDQLLLDLNDQIQQFNKYNS